VDQRLARLVDANLTITGDLDLESVLQNIVEAAGDLVGARYAALGVISEGPIPGPSPTASGQFLSRFVFTGMEPDAVERIGHLPEGHGILGLLIERPEPIRLAHLSQHPASYGFPPGHPPMGSFLGVPIRVHGRVFGNLYLTEKIGAAEFSEVDQELAIAIAAVAGSAIANAGLFAEVHRLSLIEERERIGRDLHDTVIQRLFATGLSLQAVARRCEVDQPEAAGRINDAVDELDAVIREIRGVIFSLQAGQDADGLRARVLRAIREASASLGKEPTVRFDGPIDLVAGTAVADHAVAVVREALTNVARHAAASTVAVSLTATGDRLTLEVRDDGVGPPSGGVRAGGLGLASLRHRAEQLGGEFSLEAAEPGTCLRWSVPV